MKVKEIIALCGILTILITGLLTGSGCANIVPPQGGSRDSIPPMLLRANPQDSTRNFTGNTIRLYFNEYVTVENMQDNLIVSPVPKTTPNVLPPKLNVVTIKFSDTLEPNTTYTLNFGNSIKDVDEGNIAKGFSYVFSTGKYIDSLRFSGNVILAETGKIDSTITVMLYSSADDSAITKQNPRYLARLDNKGHFIFKNLAPGVYHLYAYKDLGVHRFTNDKDLFAFADKPVTVTSNTEPVTLYAYVGKETPQKLVAPLLISEPGKRTNKANVRERLRYQTNLAGMPQDLLGELTINFETAVHAYDSTKIHLYIDSMYTPLPAARFVLDSASRHLRLVRSEAWKENTPYHIIIDKDFAADSADRKLLKTDTVNFVTKKISDYAALHITFSNLDLSKNPVLLFVTNDVVTNSFPLTGKDFSQSLFLPGDYELRILNDANKNGKWDPGQFFGKHLQPEIVKPVQRRISVKKNFENDFEIQL